LPQKKEDIFMKKTKLTIRRMAINAVMMAIYIILSTHFTIPLGGLKITIEALPVILCAVLFGPVDAAIVGGLAEFVNQLLTFGITPTTALWILPAVARGLFVGLCLLPVRKFAAGQNLLQGKRLIVFYIICLISAVIVSCLNTFTLYVDSKMFGYYSYAMVFGSFALRIITGLVATTAMAALTIPLYTAMRRAKLAP
jgi:ECF transporter S component (folate family)